MAITEDVLVKGKGDFSGLRNETKKTQKSFGDLASRAGSAMISINQGLELVQKAFRGLQLAFKQAEFTQEVMRLEQVVGRDLARAFQRATGGTISQMDAMRAASKAMTGEMHLTANQMQVIFGAADDLGKRFQEDTIVIVDRLTEAFRKGRLTELPKYGIEIDTTRSKADQVKDALEQLRKIAADPLAANEAADSVDQFKAELQDAMDSVKDFVGKVIIEMVKVFRKAAEIFRGTRAMIFGEDTAASSVDLSGNVTPEQRAQAKWLAAQKGYQRSSQGLGFEGALFQAPDAGVDFGSLDLSGGKFAVGGGGGGKSKPKVYNYYDAIYFDLQQQSFGISTAQTPTLGSDGRIQNAFDEAKPKGLLAAPGAQGWGSEYADYASDPKQLAAEAKELRELQVAAFQQSAQAYAGAADAAINALGAVFGKQKEFAKLGAIIKIAEETAMAASSFALGPPGIAAGIAHAAAAVQWGVVLAKTGGGGGGGYGGARPTFGAGAGGGYYAGSSGSVGGSGSSVVIQVGDGFVGDPHALAREIDERLTQAQRAGRIRRPGTFEFQ